MSAPLLTLTDVHTHIGAYHILHGVDLTIPRGGLTMLLGRNGAGKSTTLRTIMGLWQATPDIARLGIAYVQENMGIFSDLSVRDNVLLAARAARTIDAIDGKRLDWIFDLFPAIKTFWLHPAGKLSGGQKQMLAVARAMIEPRRLILIDEPSKGLAPAMIANMITAFRELKQTDTTILLVEQNFNFAKQLGDTVAVMDNGRIVHRGTMAELAEDESLQARLLGLSLGAA
jgi:branched-chain amino acid transport system ATP-binding protein